MDIPITKQEYNRIRTLFYKESGLLLAENKQSLVMSRLSKRLRALSFRICLISHNSLEVVMQIAHRAYRNIDVLDLTGQFNFASRKDFTAALEKLKQAGNPHVVFNFKQITFIDSAAIGLLALAAQQFKIHNRRLSIVGAQGTVKQVLDLAHIDQMIPTFPTEDAAINTTTA